MFQVWFQSYNHNYPNPEKLCLYNSKKNAFDFCRKQGFLNIVNNKSYFITPTGCYYITDKKAKKIY